MILYKKKLVEDSTRYSYFGHQLGMSYDFWESSWGLRQFALLDFRLVVPTLIIEFDSSLHGIDILYYSPGAKQDTCDG